MILPPFLDFTFRQRGKTEVGGSEFWVFFLTLKLHGMSWGVKTTCFKAPGVSLGGPGVSIGGVRSLRVGKNQLFPKVGTAVD